MLFMPRKKAIAMRKKLREEARKDIRRMNEETFRDKQNKRSCLNEK